MIGRSRSSNAKAKIANGPFLISALCLLVLAACGKRLPVAASGDIEGGVPRRAAIEMFTATWCTNCPAADQAAEELAAELGESLTLIEYHPSFGSATADPFGTVQTDQRFSYYGVSAPPVFICDGVAKVSGALPNLLAEYRSAAAGRLAKKSPVSINLSGGLGTATASYDVTVLSEIEGSLDGLRLLLVLVEDSISYAAPNGVSLHRQVVRRLAPDHPGEAFSLASGAQHARNGSIALETSWVRERLGLAALVQDEATGEVLQSAQTKLFQAQYSLIVAAVDTILDGQAGVFSEFPFTLHNNGNIGDSVILNLPDSLTVPPPPDTLIRTLCDRNLCYPLPYAVYLAPGDSLTGFKVDIMPQTSGRSTAGLTVVPKSSPSSGIVARFHVEVP
jgi:thiol-disulfide isomerase/thioredoxin